MKKLLAAASLALALSLTACTSFTPLAAGSGEVAVKHGEASQATLFGFIPLSTNCTILKAAQNGGIKHIATVDIKHFSFLGLYNSKTTIVIGD